MAVAERRVDVEFVFDRTGDTALAQGYRILVPERRGRRSNRSDHDDCSYLRLSVFGPPERGADDRVPDRRVDRGGRAVGA